MSSKEREQLRPLEGRFKPLLCRFTNLRRISLSVFGDISSVSETVDGQESVTALVRLLRNIEMSAPGEVRVSPANYTFFFARIGWGDLTCLLLLGRRCVGMRILWSCWRRNSVMMVRAWNAIHPNTVR